MKRWKIILAASVIFAAGVVTGRLTVDLQHAATAQPTAQVQNERPPVRSWHRQRTAFIDKLQKELDLTPPQRVEIERILRESQARMKELWDPIAPKAREESRRSRQEVLAVLTPEQQAKYERMSDSHHKWEKYRKHGRSETNSPSDTDSSCP